MIADIIYNPLIRQTVKRLEFYCEKYFPWFYKNAALRLKVFIKRLLFLYILRKGAANAGLEWNVVRDLADKDYRPLVSVIVPNYNHAAFLKQRLDSIYRQTYSNIEVVLLDDCSTDDSTAILQEYAKRYPYNTRLYLNEKNGGKVFAQWEKGISLAKGELVWIAESDDWCERDFLEKLVISFSNRMVMLAFAQTKFMQNDICITTMKDYLGVLTKLDCQQNFCMSANELVKYGFAISNVIPNVSSAIFRKHEYLVNDEVTAAWRDLKLCGDWFFYLNLIRGGLVYYSADTTNYYRVHKKSTSLAVQATPRYYEEHAYISSYVVKEYDVPKECFERLYTSLVGHWQSFNNADPNIDLSKLYDVEKIYAKRAERKPNILMCVFSMQMGGGETFPIFLANRLKQSGLTVTLVNYNLGGDEATVRKLVSDSLPLLNLKDINYNAEFIKSLGADVVHSHHASVDEMNAHFTKGALCRQVVTLHGMYETINITDARRAINLLNENDAAIVYTAEKNLTTLKRLNVLDWKVLEKIDNGLPDYAITPISRKSLNIPKAAFVFCLVSRGVPEKGWLEAIEAVQKARERCKKDIRLIIVGDGLMYDRLRNRSDDFLRMVGSKSNIRDYFAASDMGLLPSYFAGESFPLVTIDCLKAGRPMLASDIGEIKYQLSAPNGEYAGVTFELIDNKVDIDELSDNIINIVCNRALYEKLCANVALAKEKFDMNKIADKYLNVYKKTVGSLSDADKR